MKIGIIGKGNVGSALAAGLSRKGHEIKFGHLDPREPVSEAAELQSFRVLLTARVIVLLTALPTCTVTGK